MNASYRSTTPDIRDEHVVRLHPSHVIEYDGHYQCTGRVVATTANYVMLMDELGRLYRLVRSEGAMAVVGQCFDGRGWYETKLAAVVLHATDALLSSPTIREVVKVAMRAELDPCSFDRWLLPLGHIIRGAPLTDAARQYYRQPALHRRCLEAAFNQLQGQRQREVFLHNVMGGTETSRLRVQHGLGKSAIRTARWRAEKTIRQQMGLLPHA